MKNSDMADERPIVNFSAGPGVMPLPVLQKIQAEFLDFKDTQSNLMELSHRSSEFSQVIAKAERDLRELLDIPPEYKVLLMQGGATAQFSAVVYNLISDLKRPVDYILSGAWSEKAYEEAVRLGANAQTVISSKDSNHNGSLPPFKEWKFSKDAEYIYYCDNETIHGVEFPLEMSRELASLGIPLICDMSSNILSRKFDVSQFACIFAGAQKNIGPAGVTVVILRPDMVSKTRKALVPPLMLDYSTFVKSQSMYNTPPTFPIYVSGLVFEWLLSEIGGLEKMEALNSEKSGLVYDLIDGSGGFYVGPVSSREYRSRMNIPFRICNPTSQEVQEDLEVKFLKEAGERGLKELKGHRSVGGIRVSLYNAMSLGGVHRLLVFMREFMSGANM